MPLLKYFEWVGSLAPAENARAEPEPQGQKPIGMTQSRRSEKWDVRLSKAVCSHPVWPTSIRNRTLRRSVRPPSSGLGGERRAHRPPSVSQAARKKLTRSRTK